MTFHGQPILKQHEFFWWKHLFSQAQILSKSTSMTFQVLKDLWQSFLDDI